jgi:uncharacterized protein YndB with AHSA1/START domain
MEFTESIEIDVEPDTVFAYVGNVEKLPQYVPRAVAASRLGRESVRVVTKRDRDADPTDETHGTEGWLRLGHERHLEWGTGGTNDYHGEASVVPTDDGSLLMVTLHMANGEYLDVSRQLAASLQTIKRALEHGRSQSRQP